MFFTSSSKNLFRFTQFFRFCELMREIILTSSPVGVFYAIFRLTDFSSDPFDFLSEKQDKQAALSSTCFGDLYLWCEGRFLEVEDTPSLD